MKKNSTLLRLLNLAVRLFDKVPPEKLTESEKHGMEAIRLAVHKYYKENR